MQFWESKPILVGELAYAIDTTLAMQSDQNLNSILLRKSQSHLLRLCY